MMYNVDIEDWGTITVKASSAEAAAETAARHYDWRTVEFPVARGTDIEVMVTDENGVETRWTVSGRSEPVYWAKEVTT